MVYRFYCMALFHSQKLLCELNIFYLFNNSSGCLAVFLRLFCHFFRSLDSVIMGLKAFRHWLSCERSCSYSLCPGLTMYMTFSCNSHIIVFSFFRHWVSCERHSSYILRDFCFENLQVYLSRSENVYKIWLYSSD